MSDAAQPDPITVEVLRGALDTVADEMELVLLRSSHSTVINEALDATSAIFDAGGRTVAQAVSLPVHLGVLVEVGKRLAARFPDGEAKEGDLYVFNDPYDGGTHLPDIAVAAPVIHDGHLAGFVATMSHHADVGGPVPGSMAVDVRDHFSEGLRLPLVRLGEGGEIDSQLMAVIEANTRARGALRGDLGAQIAACRIGSERYASLIARWGLETVDAAVTALMDYAEAITRAEIDAIPDGSYSFTDWLDDDGGDPPSPPLAFTVTVTIRGSGIHFDFTGTDPQVATSINNAPASTLSACYYFVRTLAGDRAPNNDGCYRPISATLPEGTLVNPTFPAPVGARSTALGRIASSVHGAMARAAPDRFNAANCGQTSLLPVGTTDPETGEAITGVIGGPWFGGLGARPGKDGIDMGGQDLTNVYHVPIEATEADLPLRFNRLALWEDSGGAGTWRGGLGFEAEIEWLGDEGIITLRRDRHRHAPWGLQGGESGPLGRTALQRRGRDAADIPSKGVITVEAGDQLLLWTTGSGGYEPAFDRNPERVLEDVLEGRVSREAAADRYGVVIAGDRVEQEATSHRRAEKA